MVQMIELIFSTLPDFNLKRCRVLTAEQRTWQQSIIRELGVQAQIEVAAEKSRREQFIIRYLQQSGARALVLGVSGGVDSLVVGFMAQRAVEAIRAQGGEAYFLALRLPYGQQQDAEDARAALACIAPDETRTIDIQPATDALVAQLKDSGFEFPPAQRGFIIGNIKARQRMITQYACAASLGGLVLGSDHAAEVLMGYFTKYGDGAADLMPLAGLTKGQVRALAQSYGAPTHLVDKIPTADLESERPLLPDEQAFGISYQEIDAFLTGQEVSAETFDIIMRHYRSSAHKRHLPAHP